MNMYILPNSNGKARVIRTEKGEYLVSYETTVLFTSAKTGKRYRTWDGWSMTTGRHIKEYCNYTKAEYQALPYKEV